MTAAAQPTRITILVDNEAGPGLANEHGFSAWIEAAGRRLLFDTGQGGALAVNASQLGVVLSSADALILSHGHYDHTGGVPLVVAEAPTMPIYLHPAATGTRYAVRGRKGRSIGMPEKTRETLEHSSRAICWVAEPLALAPAIGLTGPIPRTTSYEDTGGPFFTDPAATRADPLVDDLAMWIRTEGGLVVVVGCCHAGLLNTLAFARQLSGEQRLRAVVGGFHLGEATEERLTRTAQALAELSPELVIPCHCTGRSAVERLRALLGNRVVPGCAGAALVLDAALGS